MVYCNPNIMRYVINNMLSQKFHASKYDNPLSLISNYFVPTLLQKYGPVVKKDPTKLKNLFSQSWGRIYQLFCQQSKVNPLTGKKECTSGLSALYYKAHKEGATHRDAAVFSDKDKSDGGSGEATFDKYGTSHNVDEIVQTVADYITLNKQTNYPEGLISQINKITHVAVKLINNIATDVHNPKFHDHLVDLLTIMLGRLGIKEKNEICSSQFILDVKRKIISSKNNMESKKITTIIDTLLTKIFANQSLNYEKYSAVQRIQIRTAFIHIIVFNINRVICHHVVPQQLKMLAQLKPE